MNIITRTILSEIMSDIVLIRNKEVKNKTENGLKQTLGTLHVMDGVHTLFTCKTLERPWLDNKKFISAIPEGTYDWVMLNDSPSFNYAHLWIKKVPDRTAIKIHAGNYVEDSQGCPLVGEDFAYINSDDYLDTTNSRDTLAELCRVLKEDKGIKEGNIEVKSEFS